MQYGKYRLIEIHRADGTRYVWRSILNGLKPVATIFIEPMALPRGVTKIAMGLKPIAICISPNL